MFVKPARERINQTEVAVHVLILNESAAHQDLRNQNQRNDVGCGLGVGYERRNEKAQGETADGGHEHQREMRPEHAANLENVIADQDEEHALDQREDRQRRHLREDVIRQSHIEIALALKHRPVANDVVRAVGQGKEHHHQQSKKQIRWNMKRRCEIVCPSL